MSVSKAQMNATNRYNAKKYDNLRIVIPKGLKRAVEAHAKRKGESINGLVNELLRADMGLSKGEWKAQEEVAD